jgi:hypothetical protein
MYSPIRPIRSPCSASSHRISSHFIYRLGWQNRHRKEKKILFLCPKGDIFFNFIFIRSVWRWLATFLPLFGKETSELYKLSVFLSGPSLLSFLYIYLSGCAFIYLSCRCASIPLQFFCPALMQSATGWPGWANFRILGDCFLWAVLLKIAQVSQINGLLFPV